MIVREHVGSLYSLNIRTAYTIYSHVCTQSCAECDSVWPKYRLRHNNIVWDNNWKIDLSLVVAIILIIVNIWNTISFLMPMIDLWYYWLSGVDKIALTRRCYKCIIVYVSSFWLWTLLLVCTSKIRVFIINKKNNNLEYCVVPSNIRFVLVSLMNKHFLIYV